MPTVTNEPTNEKAKESEQKVSEIPVKQADEVTTAENKPQNSDNTPITPAEKEELNGMIINENTGKDKYLTDPVPEGKPLPIEPQDAVISDKKMTCTLSVQCDTILNNIEWLDKDKVDIVPKDGVIFAKKTVTFYEGESVFNRIYLRPGC